MAMTRRAPHRKTLLGESADWANHQRQERAYLEAERRPLLDVASTRGRDLRVVKQPAKPGKARRPWQLLEPYLLSATALTIPSAAAPAAPPLPDLSVAARAAAEAGARGVSPGAPSVGVDVLRRES